MRKQLTMALIAAAGLFVTGTQAEAGRCYDRDQQQDGGQCIDLSKYCGETEQSKLFEGECVDITATASYTYCGQEKTAWVSQSSDGLGVKTHRRDDSRLDGYGDEVLKLSFSKAFQVNKVQLVKGRGHESIHIFSDDHDFGTFSFGKYDYSPWVTLNRVVSSLYFKVTGNCDDFRVKKICGECPDTQGVPTPAAAGLGIVALGALAMRRRRNA